MTEVQIHYWIIVALTVLCLGMLLLAFPLGVRWQRLARRRTEVTVYAAATMVAALCRNLYAGFVSVTYYKEYADASCIREPCTMRVVGYSLVAACGLVAVCLAAAVVVAGAAHIMRRM